MRKERKEKKSAIDKVLARIEVGENDECWEWPGATTPMGYGRVGEYVNGKLKMRYPHRLMHKHFNGPVSDDELVMHKCDNPRCCNPNHLTTGSNADNTLDMCTKDRSLALLTPEQVRDIRTAHEYGHSITEIYTEVHPEYFAAYKNPRAAVWAILNGYSYRWVAA